MVFTLIGILILIAFAGYYYKRKLCKISDTLSNIFRIEVEIKIAYIDILISIDYILIIIINAIYSAYNIELGDLLSSYYNIVITLIIIQAIVIDNKFIKKRKLRKLKDTI